MLSPEQVNDLSNTIIQVLQGDQVSLSLLITQAASLASTFEQRDVILSSIISNLNGVVAGLANRSAELDTLIAQTRTLMSGLYVAGPVAGGLDRPDRRRRPTRSSTWSGRCSRNCRSAQNSTTAALNLLVGNGAALDQAAIDLPPVLTALARFTSYGTYANRPTSAASTCRCGACCSRAASFPRSAATRIRRCAADGVPPTELPPQQELLDRPARRGGRSSCCCSGPARSNRLASASTSIDVEFAQAAGMKTGDKVKVAGIDVGEVKSMELEGDHVLAVLDVQQRA